MGMVEVSGLAVGPYTLVAPITARPCYYYRTLVWEWKQNGKNKSWVKVAGECMHVPFFVDDNTGRVLVDPRGADLDLHRDFQQEFCDSFFTTKDPAPSNVNGFLARKGIVTSNKIKVEEYCIKPKNSLFILGTLSENPGIEIGPQPVEDAEPIYSGSEFSVSVKSSSFTTTSRGNDFDKQTFAEQLAMPPAAPPVHKITLSAHFGPMKTSEMSQQQKIAAALLKAGIANPAAWSAAGMPAGGISVSGVPSAGMGGVQVTADPSTTEHGNGSGADASEANGFVLRPPVVLMKGTNNKTFLISWRSQQEVARSLGWKCALMIWGGPALALASLYIFLNAQQLF